MLLDLSLQLHSCAEPGWLLCRIKGIWMEVFTNIAISSRHIAHLLMLVAPAPALISSPDIPLFFFSRNNRFGFAVDSTPVLYAWLQKRGFPGLISDLHYACVTCAYVRRPLLIWTPHIIDPTVRVYGDGIKTQQPSMGLLVEQAFSWCAP